jgi:NAD(P)-dependent dehydrogenase (short-subunit alcohol dehydrogenase family)
MNDRRVAVVTGGTAGVGRAVVRELASHGWDVAVLARGEAGLDGAVHDVEADWYLARTGVKGQLSKTGGPRYGSNVETPKDDEADRGAHGMFDAKATSHDPWSWISMHRAGIAWATAAAGAGLLLRLARRR